MMRMLLGTIILLLVFVADTEETCESITFEETFPNLRFGDLEKWDCETCTFKCACVYYKHKNGNIYACEYQDNYSQVYCDIYWYKEDSLFGYQC
jgi:hypothetical protein